MRFDRQVVSYDVVVGRVRGGYRADLVADVGRLLVRYFYPVDFVRHGRGAEVVPPAIVTIGLLRQRRLGDISARFFRMEGLSRHAIGIAHDHGITRIRFVCRWLLEVYCFGVVVLPIVAVFLCLRNQGSSCPSLEVGRIFVVNED